MMRVSNLLDAPVWYLFSILLFLKHFISSMSISLYKFDIRALLTAYAY